MNDKTKATLAIERLKIEKDEIEEETCFWSGHNYGFNWCLDAHYKEIQIVRCWDGKSIPNDKLIKGIVEDTIYKDELMDYDHDPKSPCPFNKFALKYFDGFVEGVEEWWDLIKNLLK